MPASHYQSRMEWQRKFSDLSPLKVFWKEVTKEMVRILKPSGHAFVFCNCDSYPVFYEPMYNHFDKLKSIIWNKTHVGLGRIFRNQHELIIWGRWKEYAEHGHGGDKDLKPLIEKDASYAKKYFQWCILETLPLKILKEHAIDRESLYKRKFGTRVFGYNNN